MDKDTRVENFGPSHYDYDFDFDVDFRLKAVDYVLLVPYVLVIFPVAWVSELVMSQMRRYGASAKTEDREAISQSDFHFEEPLGRSCQWPRHSHV